MDKESKEEYWSNKYKSREEKLGTPEKFIVDNIDYLNKESLLDFACGDGRNAIYLAKLGFKVLGVDFSKEAIKRLEKFSGQETITLETRLINLEEVEKVKALGKLNNIILNHYKPSLEILKVLPELLHKDGILIICTFNYRQSEEEDFPREFCLEENELIDFSNKLELLKHNVFKDEHGYKDGYIFKLK